VLHVLAPRPLEDVHPAAAGALPDVHGGVGVAQQLSRRDRRRTTRPSTLMLSHPSRADR
jgi:hypothetical protein